MEQLRELNRTVEALNKNEIKPSKKGPPVQECVPCLYLPCEDGANKLVLYFHGNAEDIGLAYDLMFMFGTEMKYHVLAIEYPGYGLYKTSKPDENMMREDADTIYDYLT
jgi:hypothetical protein